MREGQLHGPALFIKGDGYRWSFSKLINGKASCFAKQYYPDGKTANAESARAITEVGGWANYVGNVKDGR
jgi:hypothetical protein